MAVALLIAAASVGCSGNKPPAETRYLTVFVAKDGAMEVAGHEASLMELENAVDEAAKTGALVLFAREPTARDRAAYGMMVLQTIRSKQVRVRFCGSRDFKDAIGPDGKLLPE